MNQAFSKIWILIILIVFAVGGFFAWYQFIREPEVDPVIDPKQEIVAPRAVLRGNRELTSLLPLNVRQGYVAIYDIFYQEEIVGEVAWIRIEENKTKVIQTMNIPELYQEESETVIVHSLDLEPKSVETSATIRVMDESISVKMNVVVDYNANLVNTILEANGNVLPAISDAIIPNTATEINVQDLYVGWEVGNVKVVEKVSVTVPAGTFEVLVVEISGTIMGVEGKTTYYITPAGEMIKSSTYIPGFEFSIVTKLRSYLPK